MQDLLRSRTGASQRQPGDVLFRTMGIWTRTDQTQTSLAFWVQLRLRLRVDWMQRCAGMGAGKVRQRYQYTPPAPWRYLTYSLEGTNFANNHR